MTRRPTAALVKKCVAFRRFRRLLPHMNHLEVT
jgi:hypothetical protein